VLIAKTDVLRIREHVFDDALLYALLARLPPFGREQVGVVFLSKADARITEQECAKLFGNTSDLPIGYHGSEAISSSSVRACGIARNWQSVMYSISS
jgi:hypothetical protein